MTIVREISLYRVQSNPTSNPAVTPLYVHSSPKKNAAAPTHT